MQFDTDFSLNPDLQSISVDLSEMYAFIRGLAERRIPFICRGLYDGMQVIAADESWDVVCHGFSYGHEDGLLEIMGDFCENESDSVEGWLAADTILSRMDRADS